MSSEILCNRVNADSTAEIPIALDRFIEASGVADVTVWRWRKKGWLKTCNIAGRVYIHPQDLREFNRRMIAGDFAKEHVAPKKKKADTREDASLVLTE